MASVLRSCVKLFRPKLLRPVLINQGPFGMSKCNQETSHSISNQVSRCFSNSRILQKREPPDKSDRVTIYFLDRDGDRITTHAKLGQNLLDVAIDNDIDLEGIPSLFLLRLSEMVNIYFVNRDGKKTAAKATVGDNLLDVIIDNDIDIDGFGACEGTMACSTCHLIFKEPDYDSIPDKPTDEELDMLDLAYGLSDTSRLGCQVYVRKDMEGWEVTVPSAVADAREP